MQNFHSLAPGTSSHNIVSFEEKTRHEQTFVHFLKTENIPVRLRRQLCWWGVSLTDTEDCCQQALLVIWENIQNGRFRFQQASAAKGYLARTARNIWLGECRRRKHRSAAAQPFDSQDWQASDLPDFASGEAVAMQEREAAIWKSLDVLDEKSRCLLVGFHVEGIGYERLAKELKYASAHVAREICCRRRKVVKQAFLRRMAV